MSLQSLLVCADDKAVHVLTRVLKDLAISVAHCPAVSAALPRLAEQRFDAIVVDCADEPQASELLKSLRLTSTNLATLAVALVDGGNNVRNIFAMGANFILYKPVSVERARSSLRAARGLMRRERRRHARVAVHTQASIGYGNVEGDRVTLVDLSEEGVALQAERRLPPACKVYFQFALPGHDPLVRLSGEVVWQDSTGRVGIRFVDVPQASRRLLKDWLQNNLSRKVEDRRPVPQFPLPSDEALPRLAAGSSPLAGSGKLPSGPGNRRGPSRHACNLGTEVYRAGSLVPHRCALSDISKGGCYVEIPSPFPSGLGVEIVVRARDMKLRMAGVVQAVHPGFGMGVEFTLKTAEQRDDVQKLIALVEDLQSSEPALP